MNEFMYINSHKTTGVFAPFLASAMLKSGYGVALFGARSGDPPPTDLPIEKRNRFAPWLGIGASGALLM
jgi:hypothetical protein